MQMDRYTRLRCRHEDGVLAYFLRRTGSAELAWELSAETWATARLKIRRRGGALPPPAWVFAVARETLRESLHAGYVPDRSRRRAGAGRVELTDAGVRWVSEVATEASLAALVAGLQPALREAVMAPVPPRDAAALAARIRVRPAQADARLAVPRRRRSLRLGRLGLAPR
jgi:DNA-directed RNA polymerase specialized sigma24 family protein